MLEPRGLKFSDPTLSKNDCIYNNFVININWEFWLLQILNLLGMYFDDAVVFFINFRLALAMLWLQQFVIKLTRFKECASKIPKTKIQNIAGCVKNVSRGQI